MLIRTDQWQHRLDTASRQSVASSTALFMSQDQGYHSVGYKKFQDFPEAFFSQSFQSTAAQLTLLSDTQVSISIEYSTACKPQ